MVGEAKASGKVQVSRIPTKQDGGYGFRGEKEVLDPRSRY